MSTPELNKPAPNFDLPATSDKSISLSDLQGSKVVLFFYPRDDTPGCTTESQNFRDTFEQFTESNTIILGISQDSVASHEKFKAKQEMPFDLLSDESGEVCQAYDVIRLKKMYGKEFEGIERSTFVMDETGVLRAEWRKVKVPGHVEEVLAAIKQL